MSKQYKKKTLLCKIGITMILIYSFFIGLKSAFFNSSYGLMIWIFIASACIVIAAGFKKNKNNLVVISWICILIMIVNRNSRFSHGFIKMDLGIITLFVLFTFLQSFSDWHGFFLSIMMLLGLFYTSSTIFLFLFPQVYLTYVVPMFGTTQSMRIMIYNAKHGMAVGFSAHYSTTAIYLVSTIAVPISAFMRKHFTFKSKKFYGFMSVLTVVTIFLTGKRAHSLFVVAAALFCYYAFNRDKKFGSAFKIIVFIIFAVVVYIIAAQFIQPLQNIIIRFQKTMAGGDVTVGRLDMLNECISMFKSNYLIGTGWGSFTYYTSSGLMNAHNVFAQLLAENGLILSIPFFAFIIMSFSHAMKVAKSLFSISNPTRTQYLSIVYSVFIQTFFLMYCLTGNPLYDFQMLCPYIFGCSIVEYYYQRMCVSKTQIESVEVLAK